MVLLDENEILVTSIGETTLAYLGKGNVARLRVELLPGIGEARVMLTPVIDEYEEHLLLLTKFADVEDIFASEVSMTIRLVPANAPDYNVASSKKLAFTA